MHQKDILVFFVGFSFGVLFFRFDFIIWKFVHCIGFSLLSVFWEFHSKALVFHLLFFFWFFSLLFFKLHPFCVFIWGSFHQNPIKPLVSAWLNHVSRSNFGFKLLYQQFAFRRTHERPKLKSNLISFLLDGCFCVMARISLDGCSDEFCTIFEFWNGWNVCFQNRIESPVKINNKVSFSTYESSECLKCGVLNTTLLCAPYFSIIPSYRRNRRTDHFPACFHLLLQRKPIIGFDVNVLQLWQY